MAELNNTFKVVVTDNEGKENESIITGPVVFSTSINGETNGIKYAFRLREYSEGYDVEILRNFSYIYFSNPADSQNLG